MLSKLITFIKNLHPIKNFARPINQPRTSPSFISLSYESLVQELKPAVRLETIIPTFHDGEPYTSNAVSASYKQLNDAESNSVLVMPRVEIRQETNFSLAPAVKDVEYSEPEKMVRLYVHEMTAELPVEISAHESATEEPVVEPIKKRTKAPAKPKKPAVIKKTTKKTVKASVKTKKVARISPRKKKSVPPEAMGFGF